MIVWIGWFSEFTESSVEVEDYAIFHKVLFRGKFLASDSHYLDTWLYQTFFYKKNK